MPALRGLCATAPACRLASQARHMSLRSCQARGASGVDRAAEGPCPPPKAGPRPQGGLHASERILASFPRPRSAKHLQAQARQPSTGQLSTGKSAKHRHGVPVLAGTRPPRPCQRRGPPLKMPSSAETDPPRPPGGCESARRLATRGGGGGPAAAAGRSGARRRRSRRQRRPEHALDWTGLAGPSSPARRARPRRIPISAHEVQISDWVGRTLGGFYQPTLCTGPGPSSGRADVWGLSTGRGGDLVPLRIKFKKSF